jgi:hypothetical protein
MERYNESSARILIAFVPLSSTIIKPLQVIEKTDYR